MALAMRFKIRSTFSLFVPKRLGEYPCVVLAIDFERENFWYMDECLLQLAS